MTDRDARENDDAEDERRKGPWVKDPETALDLIKTIDWGDTEADMVLLRELSMVVDGQRKRIRFEVGDYE